MKIVYIITMVSFFCSCGTYNSPYYKNEVDSTPKRLPEADLAHRLYLIGDAGGLDDYKTKENYVFNYVAARMEADTSEKSLIFLGDNIYNDGLQKKGHPDRKREESILDAHLQLALGNDADVYFIPGNHDWNDGKKGGLDGILRQADYIEDHSKAKGKIKFYPDKGCGDPKVIKVNKDLVYVMTNTQWWVSDWSLEPKLNKGCEIKSRREFLDRMKDIIVKHKNDQIVIFMHHPMISNGNHGGKFSLSEHLIPLKRKSSWLALPLPIIGSVYPIIRQLGFSRQDVSYHLIQELHDFLKETIRTSDASRVVFASGHDHILQHNEEQGLFNKFPINYILSGAGYKENFGAKGHDAQFVHARKGYGTLSFYNDGSTWLDFYTLRLDGKSEQLSYRKKIFDSRPGMIAYQFENSKNEERKTTFLAPNPNISTGSIYKFFLGEQYRPSWTTPIKTDLFELGKFHDGLTPIKKGGGLFSKTLRLRNSDEKEYLLRSVNKDFYKAVPDDLKHLEVLKLYEDQNTAAIPYGALFVAELSKYTGIYQTGPSIVYLDDSEQLGPFAPYFPQGHYLLEARPDGDWSDSNLFGGSSKIISYSDLLFNLRKKTTHKIDQRLTLKCRLFDMLIHDRDRHDDQWRWAAFKEDGQTIYRPIPRDRDWAFFKYTGLIPTILGEVVDKKFKSFKGDRIDIKSLSSNANNFDRYFLNELVWEDWDKEISNLLAELTDENIKNSLLSLPVESRAYLEVELAEKLISRKNILKKEVKKYYDFITDEVEITGTDEKDIFSISTLANGDTEVAVSKESKKHGTVLRYKRLFKANETKELRLYGLGGKDKFYVNLNGKGKAKIRVIGGIGDDELTVLGTSKPQHKIQVYDEMDGMIISDNKHIHDLRDEQLETNEYDRLGYKYNSTLPWPNVAYNPDEGLSLGFGFVKVINGWRKSPYKSKHMLNLTLAPFRDDEYGEGFGRYLKYNGEWTEFIGKKWGFRQELAIDGPNFINYFGSPDFPDYIDQDNEFHWVRRSSWQVEPYLITRRQNNRVVIKVGPGYESHKLHPQVSTIVLISEEFSSEDLDRSHFLGFQGDIHLNTLDRVNHPTQGFSINAFSKHRYELNRKAHTFHFGGNISFFLPLWIDQQLTFGSNTGFQKLIGDPLFYQLPSMGNTAFFRPARANRYRGETIVFQQLDLRCKILDWNNSILPMKIGSIIGYDFGQVYSKEVDNEKVKHGWTLGLSYDILNSFVIQTRLSRNEEGTYFVLRSGFSF